MLESVAHRALAALPDTLWLPLSGRRPTIDGQRLSARLQTLTNQIAFGLRTLSDPPTAGQRRRANWALRVLGHIDAVGIRHTDLTFPTPEGIRSARLYADHPMPGRPPLVVFAHGGGWQTGDVRTYDGFCALLVRTLGVKVLSIDYRLAPETPFPGPFEDVVAGFKHAVDHAEQLGVDPERIAIMGDSAGGNLAACAALHLASQPGYRPRVAVLVYPVVDADLDIYESTLLFRKPLSRDIVRRDLLRYAPDPSTHSDPRFMVMAATDLSPMPPTYVVTAGVDVLRDQGESFGDRLKAEGVQVKAKRFDNLPHGFINLLADPDARRASLSVLEEVRSML